MSKLDIHLSSLTFIFDDENITLKRRRLSVYQRTKMRFLVFLVASYASGQGFFRDFLDLIKDKTDSIDNSESSKFQ